MQPAQKARLLRILVAACAVTLPSATLSAKDFVKPTAQPAKTYPAHDDHPDEKVAIAADPRALVEGTHTEILLRITEQTQLDAALLVTEFWQNLGLTPRVEVAA